MAVGRPTRVDVELDVVNAVNEGVDPEVVALDMEITVDDVTRIVRKYELADRHEEERMGRKRALSPDQEAEVIERVAAGESQNKLANEYGVAWATINRIVTQAHEGADVKETIIAGDKANGILRCIGADTYEGTCRRANGKMSKKAFRSTGARVAQKTWEKWCAELRAEDEAAVTPAPAPEIEVRRKEEKPEETHANYIVYEPNTLDVTDRLKDDVPLEQLLYDLEPTSPDTDFVAIETDLWLTFIERVRKAITPIEPVIEAAPAEPVERHPVCVTYMDGKGPHAAFDDTLKAMQTCDAMNAALEFAGVESRYEVREVPYWAD